MTGMRIADTKYLKEVNDVLDEGKKVALIGYDSITDFENLDKLNYVADLFDADNPFLELDKILEEIYDEYDALIIISDRRRITDFKIPYIQLIPEDINVELETIAVLNRDHLVDTIRKFLNTNNILDQSLKTLFISELSKTENLVDNKGIALEDVVMRSFDFKNSYSLEKRRVEKPLDRETSRFRNYIIEPFPIEKYNLITAYRESDNLKYSKNVNVQVINEKDIDQFDVSSIIKQIVLVEEEDYEKVRELEIPEYVDYLVINDREDREDQFREIIDYGKRGYDIVIIERDESSNDLLPELIHDLNLYAERFNISFTPHVSYLTQVGLPRDLDILEINCQEDNREEIYFKLLQAVDKNMFISLTNLPEDETFFLMRVYNKIGKQLRRDTPIALFFPEGPIITKLSMLSEDINQLYRANKILIGNKDSDRTRIDRFVMVNESEKAEN